jgi:hypothetical protein
MWATPQDCPHCPQTFFGGRKKDNYTCRWRPPQGLGSTGLKREMGLSVPPAGLVSRVQLRAQGQDFLGRCDQASDLAPHDMGQVVAQVEFE